MLRGATAAKLLAAAGVEPLYRESEPLYLDSEPLL